MKSTRWMGTVILIAITATGMLGAIARADDPMAAAPDATPIAPETAAHTVSMYPAATVKSPRQQFNDAVEAAQNKDWKTAERLLVALLPITTDAPVHSWLGYVYLQENRPHSAITELLQAIRLSPGLVDAHNNLGNAYLSEGEVENAIQQYRQAAALDPHSFQAHYNLGNAYARSGRWAIAATQYTRALALKDSARAHNNLAVALTHIGSNEQALQEYAAAARLEPGVTAYVVNYGLALKDARHDERAITTLNHAVDLGASSDEVHEALGDLYARNHNPDKALDEYRVVAAHDPNNALVHRAIASVFMDQKDPGDAITEEQLAVKIKPDLAGAWLDLGWLYSQKHDYTDAIAALKEAIALDLEPPQLRVALGNLAVAYWSNNQHDLAVDTWKRLLKIDPDNIDAHRSIAAYDLNNGMFVDAENQFRQAIAVQPQNADLLNGLGIVLEQSGRYNQAVSVLQKAVRLNPDLAEAYNNLGVAYEKKGMIAEAKANYRQALAKDPNLTDAQNNLNRFRTGSTP